MIYIIEEDGELPANLVNGGGVATNRNAIGPLAVTLPAAAVLGDRVEVHAVEAVDLTVAPPATHKILYAGTAASSVTLHGGGCVTLTRTKPAVWTGHLTGSYSFNE